MFSTLFAFWFIAGMGMIKESSSICNSFNQDTGLTKKCGYSATVNFTHPSQYQEAIKSLETFSMLFDKCSSYASLIGCSLNVPRCEENISGPFLPCRRVCDEFQKQCSDTILKFGMEWIIGMCQLLPEKDDPNTKLGYLGRCFEPPNFKTTITKSLPLKCNSLIVPVCQNIGYTKTVMSEKSQKAFSTWASEKLKVQSGDPSCDLAGKKLFCMQNFMHCVDNKAASYCRSKCERYFEMNCTSPYKPNEYAMCLESPTGRNEMALGSDVCFYDNWPRAMNWPQVRNKQSIVTSSTTPRPEGAGIQDRITSSSPPAIFSSRPTSKEIKDQKTDSPPKVEGASKPKMAAIVGGTMAVLIIIIIVLVVVIFLYRRKRKPTRTSEEDRDRGDRTTNKLLDEQKV